MITRVKWVNNGILIQLFFTIASIRNRAAAIIPCGGTEVKDQEARGPNKRHSQQREHMHRPANWQAAELEASGSAATGQQQVAAPLRPPPLPPPPLPPPPPREQPRVRFSWLIALRLWGRMLKNVCAVNHICGR